MKVSEVVKEIAAKYDREVSEEDIEYVVWTHTGYPSFWSSEDGDSPEECFRTQLDRFFKDPAEAERRLKEYEEEAMKKWKEEQEPV